VKTTGPCKPLRNLHKIILPAHRLGHKSGRDNNELQREASEKIKN
jgi:hypothetical protein